MLSRQELFAGTEAPPPHLVIDQRRLAEFLSPRIDGLGADFEIVKFKGGQSNPTYKLMGRSMSLALRRRPPGQLVATAHAIDREYRVLSAIHGAGVPVPKPWLYCADESVIGSAFYIVDFVEGRVFWDAELRTLAADERAALYDHMNSLLARIHALDFAALGLADFGKTGGYVERNFKRWAGIYRSAALAGIADMDWLLDNLPLHVPATDVTALLHGDYGLYNLIVDPDAPVISAVLDWEMSTLGDPFVDLAHHLRPWWDLPDPQGGSVTSLLGVDLKSLRIPTMEDYVALYCERAGIARIPDWPFYLAYAQFRYAAMIQGLLKRVADGTIANRNMLYSQERVFEIARLARATLEKG